MIFTIYKMEMHRNLKSFIIWSTALCGMLFLGMLFYPAINADGLLSQMDALFENPMMKGVLAAFGADVSALGSLMGFYVTYNSIYNVLLGCIFASILAGNLLAKEEADKTAEFLFTRPVSRNYIFLGKTAVLFSYITLLSLLFFIVSCLSLEAVKKDSPRNLEISETDRELIADQIKKHPDLIYAAFNLTDDSFTEYSMSFASDLLNNNKSELADMNLDLADMNMLIGEAAADPEAFFESVLTDPEAYMPLFSIPPEQRDEFLLNVLSEQQEYREMRASFFSSPELFLQFFSENPGLALSQFAGVPGSMKACLTMLDLPVNIESRIFKKYSVRKLAVNSFYIYLLLMSIGSIVLFISLLIKRGRSVLGLALGLVFFFYFINSIADFGAELSSAAAVIGYISPFTWMDNDITSPDYALVWWRVLYFLVISCSALVLTNRRLSSKDILV